jgi:hypothetical protein
MSERPIVTSEMYAQVFGPGTPGEKVLEDLITKFVRPPILEGGIDGVRKSDFRSGCRKPLDYIIAKINQASGIQLSPEEENADV